MGTRLARTALGAQAAHRSATGAFFRSSPPIRHAKCGSQYKGVPDRILKSQTPPRIKDDAYGVERSACREKPNAQTRESGHDRLVNNRATPTKKQVENDGQTIKATRQ